MKGFDVQNAVSSFLRAAVAQGDATYHPEKLAACLASYATLPCGARVGSLPDCPDAIVGHVPLGGACRLDNECASGARCAGVDPCPGVCAPYARANEHCRSDAECAAGLSCAGGPDVCVPSPREGDPCLGSVAPDCPLPLICAGEASGSLLPGKCVVATTVGVGEACNIGEGLVCPPGAACVITGGFSPNEQQHCVPIAAPGGTCWKGRQHNCPTNEYCPFEEANFSQGMYTGKCRPFVELGEPCFDTEACGYSRTCLSSGVCGERLKIGDECVDQLDCSLFDCQMGKCTAYECK